jgi:hypothetical protein
MSIKSFRTGLPADVNRSESYQKTHDLDGSGSIESSPGDWDVHAEYFQR